MGEAGFSGEYGEWGGVERLGGPSPDPMPKGVHIPKCIGVGGKEICTIGED